MTKTSLKKIVPYSIVPAVAAALYAVAGQFDRAPCSGKGERVNMTKTSLRRIVPYLIVLAVAATLYAVAGQFDFTPRAGRIGPDIWPKAILVLMMLACIYAIAKTLVSKKGADEVEGLLELIQEESAEAHHHELPEQPQPVYMRLLLAGTGLTVGYVLLIDKLGFFLDTLLFMVLFMLVGRYRKPWAVIVIGLLGSLAFMFVFMKIVYVSLPIGEAPFSAVSIALMRLMGIR